MATRKYTTLPFTEYTTTTYDTNRKPLTNIIIHSTVGTVRAAINTFSSPTAKTSAHYIVGNDGKLWAGLEEYNVGYHSGNYEMNQSSIGIENEWYQGIHPTEQLYATLAKLVADICKFYGLGCNRGVIKGHKEITPTSCPNEIDVDRVVREANIILKSVPVESIAQLKQKIEDMKQTEIRLKNEYKVLQDEMEKKLKQQKIEIVNKIINFLNNL